MNTAWMDLHGETPDDPADKRCRECGQEKTKDYCINHRCAQRQAGYCAECGELTELDDLKQDPYPVPNWRVCPKCYRESQSRMGTEIQ